MEDYIVSAHLKVRVKARCTACLTLFLVAACGGFGYMSAQTFAAAATPVNPGAGLPRIQVLENRFFFHSYEQDPIEKRLQRLELLVFGQTQPGNNQERLQHLNTTIAERDRESALKMQRQAQRSATEHPTASAPSPSSVSGSGGNTGNSTSNSPRNNITHIKQHYPALDTLEWRVLKKTYYNDSLDGRLERLETKLFGQPSSTMSYADRVDRLNRTLGIGIASAPSNSHLRGPVPKAQPDTGGEPYFEFGFGTIPFSKDLNPAVPFFDNGQQVSELFRQMNEQMEEMMKMAPSKIKPAPGWKNPFGDGGSPAYQPPPYNDPNSI